ncbi:MAG: endolytic transglycosylase MltG [Deltaproteobacteria bacterium]|uniref:Endolytic murein transglycosylase n=1 Tax=Candidatus Zymogenus saltonus TaxID=2844893 RepID=A0A9D8PP98_9DELT|nr:endolytic transglycosylase MltG [Candidatus Zymogenus saltonus]
MFKKILKWFFLMVLFLVVFAGVAAGVAYKMFLTPTGGVKEPVVIEIERGDTLMKTAKNLEDLDAIKDGRIFIAAAKIIGVERTIRTGEYEITPEMSPRDILFLILKGSVVEYHVTVPEGYNIYQISEHLENLGFVDGSKFLDLSRDRYFMAKLGIDAPVIEGYLFPDTYNLNKGMDERDIITLMVRRYFSVFNKEKERSTADSGLNDYEVLILASIVEKEAKAENERSLISAVFVNRLKKKMKLDSCATVIYGMWDDFDGNLTKEHLERMTPYNTYIIAGLPPTPICNPGRAAIRAALNPSDCNYLFFVSKNDGTHHFSETLSEHNMAVYKYQKLRTYR